MKLKFNPLLAGAAGVFTVLYVFVAVLPLPREIQFEPEWTVDASQTPEFSESENCIPFKTGQLAGYFSENGKILNARSFAVKAAVSEFYFAPYGLSDDSVEIFSPDGSFACRIDSSGFPFIDENRIFMFLPGGSSFARYSSQGKKLWAYEGFVPVTAFSSAECGTVAGFADGKVLLFDESGNLRQEFVPGGSKYSVILGADLSPDGNYLACISGLEKQRIVLAKREKEHIVITFYKYMEKDQTRQALVKFSRDGDWLYYAFAGGLGIVNCVDGRCTELKMDGWVSSLMETDIPGTFFVLTREKSRDKFVNRVYFVENYMGLSGSFDFTSRSAFIYAKGSDLFVGRDSRISKIKLRMN